MNAFAIENDFYLHSIAMYICICHAVNERTVRDAIESGHDTVDAIADQTGAGTCCGGCRQLVQMTIDDRQRASAAATEYYEVA